MAPTSGPITAARRRRTAAAAVLATLAVLGAVAGCGRDDFEDRTAVVRLGGSSSTYEVTSCGLDGQTVYLVAEGPDGAVLQGVMGLEADDETGIPASTGMSVDLEPTATDTRLAAFGAEAWERRRQAGSPPGEISSARLRGSRIQFSGVAVPVDTRDRPVPDGAEQSFSIDARCDEPED